MKDFSLGATLEIALALIVASVVIGFLKPLLQKNFEDSFEDD